MTHLGVKTLASAMVTVVWKAIRFTLRHCLKHWLLKLSDSLGFLFLHILIRKYSLENMISVKSKELLKATLQNIPDYVSMPQEQLNFCETLINKSTLT